MEKKARQMTMSVGLEMPDGLQISKGKKLVYVRNPEVVGYAPKK